MSSSDIFIGETIGTAVLILLGGGVVAAVTLKRSKALGAGWLAITFGWGFGVLTGAYIAVGLSGAHLNPAVTIGLAIEGTTAWSDVPLYIASEIFGAMIGATLVWLAYYGHFRAHLTDPEVLREAQTGQEGLVDKDTAPAAGPVLGIFSTGPEIRNAVQNLATETIATAVLVLAILTQGLTEGLGVSGTGVLMTALVVVGLGLSLGGPTGYAINPARDLGPRIVHALLPLPNKGGSDWGYAWIPVAGPLLGGAIAGGIHQLCFA
ncbi:MULTISPECIES: MIP/aquaporin family protein [Streptomyces]|uniref:Aquaporin family protein n=1 Tax=Streptomyces lycii TaxID=2654337 RepID=A0ABQ7FPF4_9ACTN|nr:MULTISPECIES: MIP/aquaporin family protein [Streptomyces]KAF4409641.1 aquaporin family protein [Streptomyces lycii]PGH51217.1 aquaporin family protein [Streptomyces sp. Ru87]